MSQVMLKLGKLKFAVDTAVYANLQREYNYNWSSQNRLQNTPVWHFTGLGEQIIQLGGCSYPGKMGSSCFFGELTKAAEQGKSLLLVSGTGEILGYWVVKSFSQKDSSFALGGVPQKVNFTIKLSYYGEQQHAL
ncbi:phage tail protein [Lentisphaerota bacterium ZTH]|nr:phage tail protein [Lentisphaerota bacterium]WET05835.1 phage tail protein [Lentisphaerota bacterium ZTH]